MPDAVLPLLVGEDSGQTLEDIEVEFPSPAVEIEPPTKVVEIERCEAIPGKVIVVGRVIKSTWFAGNLRLRRDRGAARRSAATTISNEHMRLYVRNGSYFSYPTEFNRVRHT